MSYLPGKFVWFEHASGDTAKARKFYEALLGWHTERMPMGEMQYEMVMNGADGIGGYTGGAAGAARWVSYLSVPDVDGAYAAALAAGAKSESEPTDYGLGFKIQTRNGVQSVSHGGSQEETKTHLVIFPGSKSGVVVMCNSAHGSAEPIANAVAALIVPNSGR